MHKRMGEIVEANRSSNDEGDEMKKVVEITVKSVGPAPSSRLIVPSPIKVLELRKLISSNGRTPTENLRLILRGNVLDDSKDGDDVSIQLNDGGEVKVDALVDFDSPPILDEYSDEDVVRNVIEVLEIEDGTTKDNEDDSLIVAAKPKPPAKHSRDGFDDDDNEDDLKFQLPQSTSWWKRKLFYFLHDKLKLPDILLMAIFSLSLKMWAIIILWFILAPIAHRWDLGPLYILGTGFVIIFLNLGKRQHGDVSAYSIFNEDFRELPGTLNADRLDRDIRAGQF